jgi:Mg-chelatase subunit ChlD
MGFLDYAWNVSVQKDNKKLKILQDPSLDQASLKLDDFGFTIKLPPVKFLENGKLSFIGHKFDQTVSGKNKIGRLFRACVLHTTAHTLIPLNREKIAPCSSDPIIDAFAKSVVRDAYVNSYLKKLYPDRLIDIAYANAIAFQKIKPLNRIFSSSTRIMTAILIKMNLDLLNGTLSPEEGNVVKAACDGINRISSYYASSFAGEQVDIGQIFDQETGRIKRLLEPFGPFLEAPSLSHTEEIGSCSIYSSIEEATDAETERLFVQSLKTLGVEIPTFERIEDLWKLEKEAEVMQAFNSDKNQEERRQKILSKITPYISVTNFKSVSFPEEDYTQYLRAKNIVQGASRRLLDALRTAFNYFDEDPRQEIGQLDLTAVIQAIASNKPANDVFTLEEYLKQSFAWSIILDASSSMQVKGEYGRALAIAVAEAAKELMQDPTSWTFFAFSDKFYILKDSSESYSQRVRARIGGLKFEGLTFIPDAVKMAGKMLAKRFEEQRVLVVISDGWPYGYHNMSAVLKESVDDLLSKGVIVLGIGVETDRMKNYFRLSNSIYTPKDLVRKFANTFVDAAAKALET